VIDGRIYPLDEVAPERPELHHGVFDLLQRWDSVAPALQALADQVDSRMGRFSADDRSVRVLTPIRYPGCSHRTRARRGHTSASSYRTG
jgi:hypothetical protein